MTTPFDDIIKDIPGYKVVLKSVIKSQIQHLVEQLAATTDEESVILTASVSDGTLSHLGSESGKGFLRDHEDLKLQFLGFCLKNHYEQKQFERQCRQSDVTFNDTYNTNDFGNCETYIATPLVTPRTSDSFYNTTSPASSHRPVIRPPRIRFEPYMAPKAPRRLLMSLQHGRNETKVVSQSYLPTESQMNEGGVDEFAGSSDQNIKLHVSEQIEELPISQPNVNPDTEDTIDPAVSKVDTVTEFVEKEVNQEFDYTDVGHVIKTETFDTKASSQSKPLYQIDESRKCSINEEQPIEGKIKNKASNVTVSEEVPNSAENDGNNSDMDEELPNPAGNNGNNSDMDEELPNPAENNGNKSDMDEEVEDAENKHTSTIVEVKDKRGFAVFKSEELKNSKDRIKKPQYSPVIKRKEEKRVNIDIGESYVSRLRSSKALRRKYEVNNALKKSKARRRKPRRRAGKRKTHAHILRLASVDKISSNMSDNSVVYTESELDVDLNPYVRCIDTIKNKMKCDEMDQTRFPKNKISHNFGTQPDEIVYVSHLSDSDKHIPELVLENVDLYQNSTCDQKIEHKLIKQEINSDSESEIEITAVEPGKVLLFKDIFVSNVSKGSTANNDGQKKSILGRKPGRNKRRKTSNRNKRQTCSTASPHQDKGIRSFASFQTMLRRFNINRDRNQFSLSTVTPGFLSDQELGQRPHLPRMTPVNFHPRLKKLGKLSKSEDAVSKMTVHDTTASVADIVNETSDAKKYDKLMGKDHKSLKQTVSQLGSVNINNESPIQTVSQLESINMNNERTKQTVSLSGSINMYNESPKQTVSQLESINTNKESPSETLSQVESVDLNNEKPKQIVSQLGSINMNNESPKQTVSQLGSTNMIYKGPKQTVSLLGSVNMNNESPKHTVLQLDSVDRNHREKDTLSPVSMYNSYSESDNCQDEMISDSSASTANYFPYAEKIIVQPNHTVSSNKDATVNATFEKPESALDLQITHVEPGGSLALSNNWEQNILKKRLSHHINGSEKGLRLAKHEKERRLKKRKGRRKHRQLLKMGRNTDPENYCYNTDSATANVKNSSTQEHESQVPSTTLRRVSLDSKVKLLSISNDEWTLSSDSEIAGPQSQGTPFALDENISIGSENMVNVQKNPDKTLFNKCDTGSQLNSSEKSNHLFPHESLHQEKCNKSLNNTNTCTIKGGNTDKLQQSDVHFNSDDGENNHLITKSEEKRDRHRKRTITRSNIFQKISSWSELSVLPEPLDIPAEDTRFRTHELGLYISTESEKNVDAPLIQSSFRKDTGCKYVLSSSGENVDTSNEVSTETGSIPSSQLHSYSEVYNQYKNSPLTISDYDGDTCDGYEDTSTAEIIIDSADENCFEELEMYQGKEGPLDIDKHSDSKVTSPNQINKSIIEETTSPSTTLSPLSTVSSSSVSPKAVDISECDITKTVQEESNTLPNPSENNTADSEITQHNESQERAFPYTISIIEKSLPSVKTELTESNDSLELSLTTTTMLDSHKSDESNRDLNFNGHEAVNVQEMVSPAENRDKASDVNTDNAEITEQLDQRSLNSARFSCGVCGMLFRFKSILTIHMRVHTGEKPFTCDRCERSYTQKAALNRHMLIHPESRHFKCRDCSTQRKRKCPRKYTMENRSSRRFLCIYCGRRYMLKSSLERHTVENHRDEICIKCRLCSICTNFRNKKAIKSSSDSRDPKNYSVGRKSSYISSEDKDTNECKPVLKCNRCDKEFGIKIKINTAVGAKRTVSGPYKIHDLNCIITSNSSECDFCDKTFSSETYLKKHTRTTHYGELFKCTWCRKMFTKERSLKVHAGEYHQNKSSGSDETETGERRKYRCEVCGIYLSRKTQLKVHMDIYHSNKRFICPECKKVFSYKSCLTRHIKLKHAGYYSSQI